jgi:hypothetical protein
VACRWPLAHYPALGTAIDVAAQELRIESYFPADDATDRWLHAQG